MITETVLAPAKINWSLKIGALQAGGLHAIATDIQKISLSDRIEITIREERPTSTVRLSVEADAGCEAPADESNLVVRAARAFFGNERFPELEIHLQKHIPSEAGLGGGSSDAAALLKVLAARFPCPPGRLREIALGLGSELPFFIEDCARAMVSGTGEVVDARRAIITPVVLCVPPDTRVATGWAFRAWDQWQGQGVGTANDFEALVFERYPILKCICDAMRQAGADYAGLSGSGGTVFGAFAKEAPAGLVAAFRAAGYWACEAMTLGDRPQA